MRWLVNYIRSVLCKHDWEREEAICSKRFFIDSPEQIGVRVSATCKKCGWHKSYWKF